jgi:hypothetical protein
MPDGKGIRCWGFFSEDGLWARCTRQELAGNLPDKKGFGHRLGGECRCGAIHGNGWVPPVPLLPKPLSGDNRAYARKLWEQGVEATGTLVGRYLEGRGITIPLPNSLRYHPELKHTETGSTYPGLLSAVTVFPTDDVVGIQRIYLQQDGSGKANVKPNKMSLGPTSGGAVQLAEAGEVLGLAEGVETALSVYQELRVPVWAVLGAGNFANVVLPSLPLASEVYLYIDGDDASRDAAADAGDRFVCEERKVVIVPAPDGKDFNDLLMEDVAHGYSRNK